MRTAFQSYRGILWCGRFFAPIGSRDMGPLRRPVEVASNTSTGSGVLVHRSGNTGSKSPRTPTNHELRDEGITDRPFHNFSAFASVDHPTLCKHRNVNRRILRQSICGKVGRILTVVLYNIKQITNTPFLSPILQVPLVAPVVPEAGSKPEKVVEKIQTCRASIAQLVVATRSLQ